MVTFSRADDYRAAKFGMEQAIRATLSGEPHDLTAEPTAMMRAVFDLALQQSALFAITRKTKAIDIASIAKAREILSEAFREELPEEHPAES